MTQPLRIVLYGVDPLLADVVREADPQAVIAVLAASDDADAANAAAPAEPGVTPRPLPSECTAADVILLGTAQLNQTAELRRATRPGTCIVAVGASTEPMAVADDVLPLLDDLWLGPCTSKFYTFHTTRLLNTLGVRKDADLERLYLDATINTTEDLIWLKDAHGVHLKVNEAFCRAVGKNRSEVEGQSHYYVWNLGATPDPELPFSPFTENVRPIEACALPFEAVVRGAEGPRQIKGWNAPVLDRNGDLLGSVGVAHDVTNLEHLGAELDILLQSMPFAVMLMDAQNHIVNANEKLLHFFDLDHKAQVLGLTREDMHRVMSARFNFVRRHGHTELISRRDGRQMVLAVYSRCVHDALQHRIGELLIFRDVSREREFERKLEYSAYTDALTGLHNRRYFYEKLHLKPGRGLLYVDMDNFKQVNDTQGHHTGDQALVIMAHCLRSLCPQSVAARLGGDEFVLFLEKPCTEESLAEHAACLLQRLSQNFAGHAALAPLTASVGGVLCDGAGLTPDELVRRGDVAMYAAKQDGKQRFRLYNASLEALWQTELRSRRPVSRTEERPRPI